MVWTINIERKDYSLQEKVRYATILQQRKLSIEAIAHKMRYSRSMVRTFLNVNKLPEKYQKLLWQNVGGISIAHINDLASFFNGNITTALKHLDISLERKLTQDEFGDYLKPNLEEIERKRVESAKKAVGKITTELKEPKTPEELEKAAEALKREAKKKRESKLSSEEKIKREADKQRKKEEQKRKREEKKRLKEEKLQKLAEERAKNLKTEELLKDAEFRQQVIREISKPQIVKASESGKIVEEMVSEYAPAIEEAFSKIKKDTNLPEPERNRLVLNMLLKNLQQGLLFCPKCGQRMFECSHCHTSLEKLKEEAKL